MTIPPGGGSIRVIGRDGEGPGEFDSIFQVLFTVPDSSLTVLDRNLNRLTRFNREGWFVDVITRSDVGYRFGRLGRMGPQHALEWSVSYDAGERFLFVYLLDEHFRRERELLRRPPPLPALGEEYSVQMPNPLTISSVVVREFRGPSPF